MIKKLCEYPTIMGEIDLPEKCVVYIGREKDRKSIAGYADKFFVKNDILYANVHLSKLPKTEEILICVNVLCYNYDIETSDFKITKCNLSSLRYRE